MNVFEDYVYDIETFKHCFTFSIIRADGKQKKTFEVSKRKNEIANIFVCLDYLASKDFRMVGFNSVGFDYPIIHKLMENRNKLPKSGTAIAALVFKYAQEQIDSFRDGFGNTVRTADRFIKQVDLYRIWHFNNKARATGLKMLEFNMRLPNIEDLPFAVDQELTDENIDKIIQYNEHDVWCTLEFYKKSSSQISFRDELSIKLGRDFTNDDDTKIGAEFFQMELEKAGIELKKYQGGKLVMKQTKRDQIDIAECLFEYYKFDRPEFQAIYEWFGKQVITETKGVFSDIEEHRLGDVAKYAEMEVKKQRFKQKPTEAELKLFTKEFPLGWIEEQELKATEYVFDEQGQHVMEYALDADGNPDITKKKKKARKPKISYWGCYRIATCLNVVINGLRIDFGVGGIHASLSETVVKETKRYLLRDADVSSMYPNLAIANRIYPEHLGEAFCDIYEGLYIQRKSYGKNTPENAMLKLALNGTYGKSNDKYSVFYDPKFTMQITINGQLSLLMLVDRLLKINDIKLVQLNTDGVTVAMLRDTEDEYKQVCAQWEKDVGLQLEFVDYSKMYIRDVNNYIAVYTDGKTKRKGAYQFEGLGWHQNQGGLVIPMAAEACMIKGIDVEEFIRNHKEKFDFMLRTKVPRSSKLIMRMEDGTEVQQQNICRYYPSVNGGKLIKVMPPLEGKESIEDRELGIDTQWNVKTCNNIENFEWDIDYNYYIAEAKKLIIERKTT
jgi:hypothetical protein